MSAASKAGEKTAEEAQSPSLPLSSPASIPEEVKPKPDDNPFAGLFTSCAACCMLQLKPLRKSYMYAFQSCAPSPNRGSS